ncbi:MAG: BREX-2 system adenine-specific DNA-methyltransferase PglX [Deltaproteobacteria bacterium]|nr:BREX-2 system adenine-specific DNA-methyltransferase PglX [Deltaproteobacteria bacterium]
MIDPATLLSDLRKLLRALEDELRERCTEFPEVDGKLRSEYAAAKAAGRTAEAYEIWRDETITQAGIAWILGCVFVRFLEDNLLLDDAQLSGPGTRLHEARDRHTLFFQKHPTETDREYLHEVFRQVAKPPAAKELYREVQNPLWSLGLSGDGAAKLLQFWQRIDPATGRLVHDFADPDWSTRFLGDLYQELSEAARKKYALLQTPEFVEEFILDRTLTPAIEEFGYRVVRLLDPTCGSAHFLLGGFRRLFDLWVWNEPGANARVLAQRALDGVYGIDLNPFAVAIARFRLLIAALKASDITKLKDAPGFRINLAAGDSLLHGRRFRGARGLQTARHPEDDPIRHVYETEDRDELRRILGQQYHAVVGNPPYITAKDDALDQAYRARFGSCHRRYSLGVPFTERFFELALAGGREVPSGYVGMITANSFMKREFGKKLIEEVLPKLDLTHVIDTSGAYIPGHGTPTVVLFGRHREPVGSTVRTVMGIKGEPSAPDDPGKGLVWSSICSLINVAGSESDFVSVTDTPRATFEKHPWSIGGGGAADLRECLGEKATTSLDGLGVSIGFMTITGEDNCLLLPPNVAGRQQGLQARALGDGEGLRDWGCESDLVVLWPNTPMGERLPRDRIAAHLAFLWPYRTALKSRKAFGTPVEERGIPWWALREVYCDRFVSPLSIVFAFVATHNHFVLDRGGKVFNRSAPVIKLPKDATEDDHLALLGLLNSSTACFWMKQVFHNKGLRGQGGGITSSDWEQFYEFTGTGLLKHPIPAETPVVLARKLDRLVQEHSSASPAAVCAEATPTRERLERAKTSYHSTLRRMIALQEELDWRCYRLYGVVDVDLSLPASEPPEIELGGRAFEISMARQMARGELETAWFQRHGSTPITEIPSHWPAEYRYFVECRIALIESDRNVALVEKPEYKRRWNTEPWEEQEARALRGWLLDRLEDARFWRAAELTTCSRLADRVRQDPEFMQVAELYRGRPDFDVTALVTELVEGEAVPLLPVLRYQASGLRKREVWERTWELQRQEDAIEARVALPDGHPDRLTAEEAKELKADQVGDIPVPPKYQSADFLSSTFWRLRGKLDVPKERFVSHPHCSRETDPTLVIGWAGWNRLQQAQALAAYYIPMKEDEGWGAGRLTPLLAGILELLPWLRQWHNDVDPTYNLRQGDYFRDFLDEELRSLGITREALKSWMPPGVRRGRGARRVRSQ